MAELSFSVADRAQFEELGTTEAQVRSQLEVFKRSQLNVNLVRKCTVGDGVVKIEPARAEAYAQAQEEAAQRGRFVKFVPASGAATRMFEFLFQVQQKSDAISWRELNQAAEKGGSSFVKFKQFMENISRFAFYEELTQALFWDGLDLQRLIQDAQFRPVLQFLLSEERLNYGSIPKGLLPFHRYAAGSRTAFEEHLVEATQYVKSAERICRLHFTVLAEHLEQFKGLLEAVRGAYEREYDVRFEVDFSFQKPSTNTIAVDLRNEPLRDGKGRLVFRPGGHGALLQNLHELRDYLVYIKNIDNVAQDCLKPVGSFWKRVLGGLLVAMEEQIHTLVRRLKDEATDAVQQQAEQFARETLFIDFPKDFAGWPPSKRHHFLLRKLNRPIRVCGVVRNAGEPGGAPFWVAEEDGTCSMQIVEKAQVNFKSPAQEAIWSSSTHFNPVDLVCSMKDFEGKPFDLTRYVNPDAVFICRKSSGGLDLKALELPGLWNGAMADWVTLCVEVPILTFNPVKTVGDLLRPEHQPKGSRAPSI